jgi:hypothetical protein
VTTATMASTASMATTAVTTTQVGATVFACTHLLAYLHGTVQQSTHCRSQPDQGALHRHSASDCEALGPSILSVDCASIRPLLNQLQAQHCIEVP